MIISTNAKPSIIDFKQLVFSATEKLNREAKAKPEYYITRNGQLLEDDVKNILSDVAVGTIFEGTIEKISGQRFPDIIANRYYGVEVKSSKDEHWVTLGGSVNESTRVEDVERIFLVFGKLASPIEFRSRPYEECLSEVVVTHYPRYKIDMNLKPGKSIFDQMKISYDELRSSSDPVGNIVDFYRKQLRPGESLWWIRNVNKQDDGVPMKIRMWRTLSIERKNELIISGLVLFPELLTNSSMKYERFSLWLTTKYGIVSTSLRDPFSAGGQELNFHVGAKTFEKASRVLVNIFKHRTQIYNYLMIVDEEELKEMWKVKSINADRVGQWISIVSSGKKLTDPNTYLILKAIFGRI